MKKLHWHTDDNPCTLCGVPVTPETWGGGIIQRAPGDGGHWLLVNNPEYWLAGIGRAYAQRFDTPLYPPRGWAGKSEDELWGEMGGDVFVWGLVIYDTWQFGGIRISLDRRDGIGISACAYDPPICTCPPYMLPDANVVILALQNAQVLSRRLREQSNG